jgi:methionyl aminopeptidase
MKNRLIFLVCILLCLQFWSDSYQFGPPNVFSHIRRRITSLQATGFQQFTGKLRPGKLSPTRTVPDVIIKPHYAIGKNRVLRPMELSSVVPLSSSDIEKMRVAGRLAREVLDCAIRACKAGVTTDQIDEIVHQETILRNSYPSPLNYHGFPKSCCTSVNEIMCHGIPDSTVLQEGDSVNLDITLFHDGVHGDCSESVIIGNVSTEVKDLIFTTYTAWDTAVKACKPGMQIAEIGSIIEDIVTPKGYSIPDIFVGHG